MSLKWPLLLLLVLLPTAVVLWRRMRKPKRVPVFVAETSLLSKLPSFKKVSKHARMLRIAERATLSLLLVTLLLLSARPQSMVTSYNEEKSRDIVLLLDVSGSMKPYIPIALNAMERMYKENPGDRYSIVVFASRAYPVLPLTRDQVAIQQKLDLLREVYEKDNDPNYRFQQLSGFGTDIGEGVLGAVNRFTDIETYKSRNVILLSDLQQSGGDFDPNNEFYLEKISLLPKHRINFFIMQTPGEFEWSVNTEIIEAGGGKAFEIDESNAQDSARVLMDDIFKQVYNTNVSTGRNLVDMPVPVFLVLLTLSTIWGGLLLLRSGGKK